MELTKPPYRVPTMGEVSALPWNGFKVVSTFSGCGGSCLGYRMAGFRVVWANEFVPAAQESYEANAAPTSQLDRRDIREVTAKSILEAIEMDPGDLDLFDGSPPCQAFSTAGKREKGWGDKKKYEGGAEQCNEDLFFEYVRLLDGLKPKVFVAENVTGLVKGTAKGYFIEIMGKLKGCGYNVRAKVLDAQWLGVPQARQRVIFIGVRDDLGREPTFPKPLGFRYSVRDALPNILQIPANSIFDDSSGKMKSSATPSRTITCGGGNRVVAIHRNGGFGEVDTGERPSPTITATQCGEVLRKFTIDEVKRICAFPDDFVLAGSYAQQWKCLGNSVPPLMMRAIALPIADLLKETGKTAVRQ